MGKLLSEQLTEFIDKLAEDGVDVVSIDFLRKRVKDVTAYEQQPWWHRMSNEDIAAELSATFDLGLDLTRRIADWMLEK